ncbi:MAG TPA: hypothetical protein VH165_24340 [Kofleriaceae bacterium]|jgi:hypothetical protein|nr:hypothetical protein [Kofleriaceae bacterium]
MPDLRSPIDLLLVDAERRAPVLPEVERMAASRAPAPEPRPRPETLWGDEHAPDDLARQRWGVIAPAGEAGDRLIDAIAPLIELRRRQQGAVQIYRVPAGMARPAGMTFGEAARWKKRVFRTGAGTETEADLPRYQLIVGDLDEVPVAVQQTQASDGLVGRIAFDDLDGYRAYADKVVGWEQRPARVTAGDAILHAVRDGTAATRRGYDALIAPAHAILDRRRAAGEVAYHALRMTGSERPSPDELWAAPADRPAVLLSLGHGVGVPRRSGGDPRARAVRQRQDQGALSFGPGGTVTGRDLAGRGFLPGGVWLAVACFAAGTPDTSDYRHWLDTLARTGHGGSEIGHVLDTLAHDRPFIAALPKAVLADPGGPLAFIGHIDLAWAYSFFDLDDQPRRRPARLVSVLQALLNRHRAGVAVRKLMNAFAEVNTELTALQDAQARSGDPAIGDAERARRAHLWMLRQDLAGYVLLGDPAVRLPIAGPDDDDPAARRAGERGGWGEVSEPRGDDLLHATEAAVLAILGGAPLAEAATRHGLDGDGLRRLVASYRAAGRAALEAALQAHRRGP